MRISILIPNYKRLNELKLCLDSVLSQKTLPFEVVIHDDASPNQDDIATAISIYARKFAEQGVQFVFIPAAQNIGYDKSLRKLILESRGDYVLFIGNDDYLMPECISEYESAIATHQPLMVSRNFNKFQGDPPEIFAVSKFTEELKLFSSPLQANLALRLCAYFGGLVFDRRWALTLDTDKWDGTLYYQYYLALNAYSSRGILCVATPTVAARSDGSPLFGETDKSNVHIIGRYSVAAREKMWNDILMITREHDVRWLTNYYPKILKELKVRMAFHVMEMFSSSNKSELIDLWKSLSRLRLLWHPVPIFMWTLNFIMGRSARYFYAFVRKLYQS
jgi:glycosyltransferase involved in cell wall biosynthesis